MRPLYESVFGWKIQKWDGPVEYWMVTTGNEGEPADRTAIAPEICRKAAGTMSSEESAEMRLGGPLTTVARLRATAFYKLGPNRAVERLRRS